MNMYQDLNGRIVCFRHLGYEAQAAYVSNQHSRTQETSVTVWERLSKSDLIDIERIMSSDYCIEDYTVMCEDCAHNALVGTTYKN